MRIHTHTLLVPSALYGDLSIYPKKKKGEKKKEKEGVFRFFFLDRAARFARVRWRAWKHTHTHTRILTRALKKKKGLTKIPTFYCFKRKVKWKKRENKKKQQKQRLTAEVQKRRLRTLSDFTAVGGKKKSEEGSDECDGRCVVNEKKKKRKKKTRLCVGINTRRCVCACYGSTNDMLRAKEEGFYHHYAKRLRRGWRG